MPNTLTVNGVGYPYPVPGDPPPWGSGATNWAGAVTTGMLQKAGGTFTLTADVNFGANFGILSKYFTSTTANPSTAGIVRLARTDSVGWRNQANDANLLLAVDSSNNLTYNGVILSGSAGTALTSAHIFVGNVSNIATDVAMSGDISITNAGVTAYAGTVPNTKGGTGGNSSAATGIAHVAAGTWSYSSIVDADISASAAIAFSKFAALTSGNILVGSAGNVATSVAVSGDITMSNAGATALVATTNSTLATIGTTGGLAISKTLAVLGASPNPSIGVWVKNTTALSTSTDQYGIISQPVSDNTATVSLTAVYGGCNTAASAFTCPIRYQFQSAPPTKGAGSTITRDIAYGGLAPVSGTNNAFLADNTSFTGNYFINSANTNASVLAGTLTVPSVAHTGGVIIEGTNTNDNAASGKVGEFISQNPGVDVTPAASGSYVNVTSISLTAGDWDVEACGVFTAGGIIGTKIFFAISLTSTNVDDLTKGGQSNFNSATIVNSSFSFPTGVRRISLAVTTTVYLVGNLTYSSLGSAVFSTSSFLSARRVR